MKYMLFVSNSFEKREHIMFGPKPNHPILG